MDEKRTWVMVDDAKGDKELARVVIAFRNQADLDGSLRALGKELNKFFRLGLPAPPLLCDLLRALQIAQAEASANSEADDV
jgi:hypothetical protein